MRKRPAEVIAPRPPLKKGGRGKLKPKESADYHPASRHCKKNLSSKSRHSLPSPDDTRCRRKIVILGVGNVLLSDEGVGVHVANELVRMDLPDDVSVVEGGTDGFRLLNVITEADCLIVVDAVRGGSDPGSIYRFDIGDVKNCPSGFRTSVHQVGILEVIDLSGLIGKTPRTTVIGIEPKSIAMGMELSSQIREKVPRIIALILDEVNLFLNK